MIGLCVSPALLYNRSNGKSHYRAGIGGPGYDTEPSDSAVRTGSQRGFKPIRRRAARHGEHVVDQHGRGKPWVVGPDDGQSRFRRRHAVANGKAGAKGTAAGPSCQRRFVHRFDRPGIGCRRAFRVHQTFGKKHNGLLIFHLAGQAGQAVSYS